MKTKPTTDSWNTILKRYSASILFFGISIFIPLFMENGYLNLTEAKAHALYLTVIPAVMLSGIASFTQIINLRGKKHEAHRKADINGLDCILACFAVTILFSALFSRNTAEAFWGNAGWSVGAATMLCLVAAYFILSRHYAGTANAWFFVLAANTVIFLLAIFHSMGLDILGLHANIVPRQFYLYVSTVGNVNWLSGYLCLILPAFFVFFLMATDQMTVILYGCVLTLGMMNVLLCLSESIFAGIWICAFFALPFILRDSKRIRRLGILLFSFGICTLLVAYLPLFAEKQRRARGLFSILLDWKAAFLFCIAGCLCFFVLPALWDKIGKKAVEKIIISTEILMAVSSVVAICILIRSYDNSWGNNRGQIWNTSIEIFRNFSLKEKLIGVGPEMLRFYYDGMTSHSLLVLTSHNEWLQWLLTTGIWGGILWAALFLWLIISYFRSHCREHGKIAFFLPLMAYLGQAMLNSPNAMNISLLCLFLALYRKN